MNSLTKEEKRIYNNRKIKILYNIEVFFCKKHNCWLTEEGCLKVQKKASNNKPKYEWYIISAKSLRDNLCSVCSYAKIIQKLHKTKIHHTIDLPKNYILNCSCCGELITRDDLRTQNGKPIGRVCSLCNKKEQTRRRDERRFKI